MLAPFAYLGTNYDSALRDIYADLKPSDLFQRKGLLRILRDDSIFDTAPLRWILEKHVTTNFLAAVAQEHALGRRLWIGTANLDARRPVIWDMGAIASSGRPDAPELFRRVMMASSAVPGAFPSVYFNVEANGKTNDELHVDGGSNCWIHSPWEELKLPADSAVLEQPASDTTAVSRHQARWPSAAGTAEPRQRLDSRKARNGSFISEASTMSM